MEEKKVVHEQEVILSLKNKSVIVSASAGSGKTSTMINKIYKTLTEEKVDISSMLVLTYTDAAATEMKARLCSLLTEKLATSENVEFLQNQIDKLSVADISTFHSFYEKLIKSNYYYLNINPAFRILEDAELEILKETAFQNAMQKIKEDKEKYLQLFLSFNKKRNEIGLKRRIFKLFNFLSAQQDEGGWIQEVGLNLVNNLDQTKNIINNFYNENIDYAIQEFGKIFNEAKSRDELDIVEYLNKTFSKLTGLKNMSLEEKQEKFLSEFTFDKFISGKDADLELVQKVKNVRENFNKFVKKVKEENISLDLLTFENAKMNYGLFLDLYKSFAQELAMLKDAKSAYDFADLEKMSLKLLQNKQVQEKVKEQYKFIFVDEFQDVNGLQNAILNLICREDNTFIVGDPKQSIYAFRQSDVQLFNEKQKQFEQSKSAESLSLINNYRSNKDILGFCNLVFSELMTEKTAKLNYAKTSLFKPEADIPTSFEPVNFLLCQKPEKAKVEEIARRYSVFDAKRTRAGYSAEVKMIYNKITELVDKEIYDQKLNKFRKIKYGDIAILARKRGAITDGLAQLFENHGVPYVLNAEKDLKKSKLVLAFISVLRIASGYHSEIDLATTLNKFFGLSYQELADIRLKFPEVSFRDATDLYAELSDKIAEKITNYKKTMDNFKFQISVCGIYLAMNFLIKNSYFNDFKQEVECVDEEEQMLNSFFKFVQESEFDNNLILLLNLIDENESLKVEQNSGAGLDQVVITTMHSSKGLEYPIVFLVGLNSDLYSNKSDDADFKVHKNLGIALKTNGEEMSIFEKAIKIAERKEALAENLRLLYVGMTRAKNHLFLTAETDLSNTQKVDENNIMFISAKYINYILGAIDAKGIVAVKNGINYISDLYKIEIKNAEDLYEVFENEEEILLSEQEKKEIIVKMSELASAEYTNSGARFISQKTSVTEVVEENAIYESVCGQPQSFDLKEHLSGIKSSIDMGVAIHEIMERADFGISDEHLKKICEEVYEKYVELGVELSENFVLEAFKVCRKAIEAVGALIPKNSQICKEKKFMIYASRKEIFGEGSDEKVLIQGIIDFFAVSEKVILIDYKYSKIQDEEKLKNRYKNQLKIYAYALENFLNRKVDKCYLLNLSNSKLIEL